MQTRHLTLRRAHPPVVRRDLKVTAHDLADLGNDVSDADLDARAEVHDLPEGRFGRRHRHETPRGVVYEREVTRRLERAQLQGGPGQRLADDRRDHGAGGLTGPVRVERPDDGHRHAERAAEAEPERIPGDLRGAVGRLGLQWVILVYRGTQRGAVDLARRGDDDAF